MQESKCKLEMKAPRDCQHFMGYKQRLVVQEYANSAIFWELVDKPGDGFPGHNLLCVAINHQLEK
jgi:hypothetical protein